MAYFGCGVELAHPSPTPSEYLYDWDFTESLVDNAQGATMTLYTPDQYESMTIVRNSNGIVYSDSVNSGGYTAYVVTLPTDVDLFQPGYELEIDFGNLDLYTYAMGLCDFFRYIDDSGNRIEVGLRWDEDYQEYDINSFYAADTVCSTSDINYFANSTLKIVTSEADNSTVWSIYKDGTLLTTTPSGIIRDSRTFWDYWDDPEEPLINPRWVVSGEACLGVVVEGLRIKQTT